MAISLILTDDHWSCLAVVIDLHASRVVGWALANKPNAQLVIEALEMAKNNEARVVA